MKHEASRCFGTDPTDERSPHCKHTTIQPPQHLQSSCIYDFSYESVDTLLGYLCVSNLAIASSFSAHLSMTRRLPHLSLLYNFLHSIQIQTRVPTRPWDTIFNMSSYTNTTKRKVPRQAVLIHLVNLLNYLGPFNARPISVLRH